MNVVQKLRCSDCSGMLCVVIISLNLVSCGSGDDASALGPEEADATADAINMGSDGAMGSALQASDADLVCSVDVGPIDDAMVASGRQLVTTHKCQKCHGETLSGNSDGVPSATAIGGFAYPPNLTSDSLTGLGCWTNEQIEEAILFGIDDQNMTLCAPMPVFAHLSDGGLDLIQARAIVAYLRSLPVFMLRVPNTPDCPELDAAAQPDADAEAGNASMQEASADSGFEVGADAPSETGGDAASESYVDGPSTADAAPATNDAGTEAGNDAPNDGTTD